jgi:CheY-like chemotaxis protein
VGRFSPPLTSSPFVSMATTIPELDSIKQQLRSAMRPKKPKLLVVDDEPDNLDLLYRTFRRDFQVSKAESGIHALEILEQEGEFAVIISDQRMPEMKGTEFLKKTLPQFPDTVRIILTGFTDIEDLVEAINSGQVYKYITKPWDPHELRGVVDRALETYELLKQRTDELIYVRSQMSVLQTILEIAQQPHEGDEILATLAERLSCTFSASACTLQRVDGTALGSFGSYPADAVRADAIASDPLLQAAIAQNTTQCALNIPADATLSATPYYKTAGIHAQLVIPSLFREQLSSVIILQWQQACSLKESDLDFLNSIAQQVALVLQCKIKN